MKTKLIMMSVLVLTIIACKKKGCTDSTANNYNKEAKKDDNSCTYDPTTSELIDNACKDYNSAFSIQTPNHGQLQMSFNQDTKFRILASGDGTDLSAYWVDSPTKNTSIGMTLPVPIIVGTNSIINDQNLNFAIVYTDNSNANNNYTYSLIDSLVITATEAHEISGQSYYYPIEASFKGKFVYWGTNSSTGLADSLTCILTGEFKLCNIIE